MVSVCVPMRDEVHAIDACLDGFAAQTHPLERLDVIMVDGGSTDGSRELVDRRAADEPWLRVVDNPRQKAAAAFNRGLEESRGEVFCLFSAHGVPDPEYVTRSVAVLEETGAAGVGGQYLHLGTDRRSNAIGRAMVSPVGMCSPHRFAAERRAVDTISHPAYRRDRLDAIGPFDETLERNSDYEFNWRLRATGEVLLFDPEVRSIYRPRPSLPALARQFWFYGRWKERVIRRHPDSLRLRHVIAPSMVAALAASPVLTRSDAGRWLLGASAAGYAALIGAGVALAKSADHDADPLVVAASFPTMHLAWGAGFLASVVEDLVDGAGG